MYLENYFLCWFPNIPRFLSDNAEEGFGCTNNNQKKSIHQAKSIIGGEIRQKTFENLLEQTKEVLVQFQEQTIMLPKGP